MGRDRDLATLLQGLAGLSSGVGAAYLVCGEPGAGKTRLVDELTRAAAHTGARAVWGRAWDGGGAPAFWPWIEILRALAPSLPAPAERLVEELGARRRGADGPPAPAEDPELSRFRRFDALCAALRAASGPAPLVIVLDDLHAADLGTLQAMHFVARALRSLPLLLLGTHRDAEPGVAPEVQEQIDRIARDATTLRLARLSREDVATWLSGLDSFADGSIDDLFAKTGGNPLFVQEALRLLRTGGRLDGAPSTVVALIRERLSALHPAERGALEAMAILGGDAPRAVLADMLAVARGDLEERLRGPARAGLVERVDDEHVRFAHGLFREQLCDDLDPPRRAALHLAAGQAAQQAAALGRVEADESAARHLLAALPLGDREAAVTTALRAGERLLRAMAFDRAAALLEGAVRVLDADPGDPGRRLDAELSLAEALARAGAAPRARALCLQAAERARATGDAARLARAALVYGAHLRLSVVDTQLVALLEESLSALGGEPPDLVARVEARLAAAQQPAEDPGGPVERARAAIARARTLNDPDTLLAVLHTAGSALVDYAPAEERLPLARELVALALPRGAMIVAQQGYARMAVDALELCDLATFEAARSAHERLGRALGRPRWQWRSALLQSMRAFMQGDWERGHAAHAEAAALADKAGDPNAGPALELQRLGVERAREASEAGPSRWEGALDALDFMPAVVDMFRARAAARRGDVATARRALDALVWTDAQLLWEPMVHSLVAEVAIESRHLAWVERLVPVLEPRVGRTYTWGVFGLFWEGPLTRWLAPLYALLGRTSEAIGAYEDALAIAESVGARPLAARVRGELAAVLGEHGAGDDAERAAALIARAQLDAADLGMTELSAGLSAKAARLAQGAQSVTPSPSAPPPQPPGEIVPSLSRQGDVWTISGGGTTAHLKHVRGVEILDQLLRAPGVEHHVLDLLTGDPDRLVDVGSAGDALDPAAKRAYQRRIEELEEDLREAEAWADAGRRDRLRDELEFLQDELGRAVGLGGRMRAAAPTAVERARTNVQKRLRAAIKRVKEVAPLVGRHLEDEVKTGIYVSYRRPRA